MAKPVEIPQRDGSKSLGIEQDFDVVKEDWNKYRLEDGTIIKIKIVVSNIYRVVNKEGEAEYTDSGEPSIAMSSQAVISVSVGEK